MNRELIADTYLRGDGIEIGALQYPLKRRLNLRFDVELFYRNEQHEVIVVIRKDGQ